MEAQKLNSLQLELLKVYSFQPSDEDLVAIRKMLASYFSTKLTNKIQASIVKKNITEEDMDKWINE